MLFKQLASILSLILSISFAAGSVVTLNNDLQLHSAPRAFPVDTSRSLPRAHSLTPLLKRGTVFKNSTTLDKSWNGAVLFSL